MPLYDYKCDGCSLRFEVDHPMSAEPVQVCPECGAQKVRKLLTTGGISVRTKSFGQSSSPPPMPSCATGGCGGGMCGM
ncbi:MAG: zinc ribbon domain-containing protein [Magnetococcales bacterium]|nr:zinc ribbon domain-containing protein [Magnetococcales bacterium]